MHVVLELFYLTFLFFEYGRQLSLFQNEPFLTHTKVFDNQAQVVVHTLKVFLFLLHLVGLFFQLFNLLSSRSDIRSKLFDLVIENELEFLKFLSLFLEVVNAFVFVADCVLALGKF